MKQIFAACAAVAATGLTASSARTEISTEAARDSVAPFYKALNAEFAKESAELIEQSTAPQWISRPRPKITCARNPKSPVVRN
jgi:hypothetical protein